MMGSVPSLTALLMVAGSGIWSSKGLEGFHVLPTELVSRRGRTSVPVPSTFVRAPA